CQRGYLALKRVTPVGAMDESEGGCHESESHGNDRSSIDNGSGRGAYGFEWLQARRLCGTGLLVKTA
ncbi:MAG: hypothetical protein OEV01_14390, partial [Nitrospira sp.]|nr:hypothetical protein [Nitrospira sp.]